MNHFLARLKSSSSSSASKSSTSLNTTAPTSTGVHFQPLSKNEVDAWAEKLKSTHSSSTRINALGHITENDRLNSVNCNFVALWVSIRDICTDHRPNHRLACWKLLVICCTNAVGSLQRHLFFRQLTESTNGLSQEKSFVANDLPYLFKGLECLTKNGKMIEPFDAEIGNLLYSWFIALQPKKDKAHKHSKSQLTSSRLSLSKAFEDTSIKSSMSDLRTSSAKTSATSSPVLEPKRLIIGNGGSPILTSPLPSSSSSLPDTKVSVSRLLHFTNNIFKLNFNKISAQQTAQILAAVSNTILDLLISEQVNHDEEIDNLRDSYLETIDTIIVYGHIPSVSLESVIIMLALFHYELVLPLFSEGRKTSKAWDIFEKLVTRHAVKQNAIVILLSIISQAQFSEKTAIDIRYQALDTLSKCGAILILTEVILFKNSESAVGLSKSFEKSGFETFSESVSLIAIFRVLKLCLQTMYEHDQLSNGVAQNYKSNVILAVMQMMQHFMTNYRDSLHMLPLNEWQDMLEVVRICVDSKQMIIAAKFESSLTTFEYLFHKIVNETQLHLASLEASTSSVLSRDLLIEFAGAIAGTITPEDEKLIDLLFIHLEKTNACSPSNVNWISNCQIVSQSIFNLSCKLKIDPRIRSVNFIRELLKTGIGDLAHHRRQFLLAIVVPMLKSLHEERDKNLIENSLDLLYEIAISIDNTPDFKLIHSQLKIVLERCLASPSIISTIAMDRCIKIFVSLSVEASSEISLQYIRLIIDGLKIRSNISTMLSALKFLVRLRATSSQRIVIIRNVDGIEEQAMALGKFKYMPSLKALSPAILASTRRMPSYSPSHSPMRQRINASEMDKTNTLSNPGKFGEWMAPEDTDTVYESPFIISSLTCKPLTNSKDYFELSNSSEKVFPISDYLSILLDLLAQPPNWEVCSYILIYLPDQLSCRNLFTDCSSQLDELKSFILSQLPPKTMTVGIDLPEGIKKPDIQAAFYNLLLAYIVYKPIFPNLMDEMLPQLISGLIKGPTARLCVHGLTLCCFEGPSLMQRNIPTIMQRMSQIINVVAAEVLEFLIILARIPALYSNFTPQDYRFTFGLAIKYLQFYANSDNGVKSSDKQQIVSNQYILTMSFNAIAAWYLSLKLNDRKDYVQWILHELLRANNSEDEVDERTAAFYDLLERFSQTNSMAILSSRTDTESDPNTTSRSWIIGNSFVTIASNDTDGSAEVKIRKPTSAITFSVAPTAGFTKSLPVPLSTSIAGNVHQPTFLPAYILLQMISHPEDIGSDVPVAMPVDQKTANALSVFDRIPVNNLHKIGVVYVGHGQTAENEILSNQSGSPMFIDFLQELGNLVVLKNNKDIYTGGLDIEDDLDGEFAYFWNDHVTQIIYHCTVMMPNNPEDPNFHNKKRHIGNNYCTIVYNDSGLPYEFQTIAGAFNHTNIIIEPHTFLDDPVTIDAEEKEAKNYFKVTLQKTPDMPSVTLASTFKIVSASALPTFVRNLALFANVFAEIWRLPPDGMEYMTNWQRRLRQIQKTKERILKTKAADQQEKTFSTSVSSGNISVSKKGDSTDPRELRDQRLDIWETSLNFSTYT